MMLPSFGRFPHGFFLLFVFIVAVSLSQAQPSARRVPLRPPPGAESSSANHSATFVGAYLADGKFQTDPEVARSYTEGLNSRSNISAGLRMRPAEVPSFVDLHRRERVLENYQPPSHAKKGVRRRFFLAWLRDDIVTFAYGRERALLSPQHGTVDSQGRVVVSDPGAPAVHVLGGGDKPFRIAGGAERRLHRPNGVAVDAEGNIYVADSDRGVVVVYDRSGNFLRDIGKIGNETLFHSPTGIAIDRENGHLYLLDTPRDSLFMLDLQGNVLKRVGRGRGRAIGRLASPAVSMDLKAPTEIAMGNGKLVVLDSTASRIRILDLQCNVLGQFNIRVLNGRETADRIGLGMDSVGNIYVSNLDGASVRIYDQNGQLRSSFGRLGSGAGEFNAPSSLWIDLMDRIYIADTNNHRVQILQLTPSSPDLDERAQVKDLTRGR